MGKFVVYTDGPLRIEVLGIGFFEKNVPKELPDEQADMLLARDIFKDPGTIKEKED